MIGHAIVHDPERGSCTLQLPEKVVILVASSVSVFLGEAANLLEKRQMQHGAEMQPRPLGNGSPSHLFLTQSQSGMAVPGLGVLVPTGRRDISSLS